MTVQDLLRRLLDALAEADIPYMLTGSYASSLHSVPRATRDIDIVIVPNREQLTRFIQLLPNSSYHADLGEALDALRRRSQFNIIDYASGWKVDFIIPPLEEFTIEELERRQTIDFEGMSLSVISPEDIIIAKLLWVKAGESELQLRDAATVLHSQASQLDVAYIQKWVRRLELDEQWRSAQEKAG